MPPLCEAGLQYKKTAGGCVTSGSVDTGLVPPQSPGYGGCHRGLCPTPEVGGGVVLGVVGGQKGKEVASDLPLASPGRHFHLPTKSLYPALNLMTQIRALKVFGTDRTRSFINNDLHIDA